MHIAKLMSNVTIWLLFLLSAVLMLLVGLSGTTKAQQRSVNLYCCLDDAGKRVCGDGPRYCWNRPYEIINGAGHVLERVGAPKTSEEIHAEALVEETKKQQELVREKEELRFSYLRSLYGSADNIDKEIQRQRLESAENKKIARSRLNTARENVQVFQSQIAGNMTTANKKSLAGYKKTVLDIEKELVNRGEQEERARKRLLADKKKLIDYEVQLEQRLNTPVQR